MEIGKTKSTKIIIAWSPVYFIVLILILYYNFYATNCNLFSVDVSVSVNSNITSQSIFLIKTSALVFTIAAGCLTRLGNIKKLTCWHSKIVVTMITWLWIGVAFKEF